MIVKRKDGYHVLSEKGKNLGGPYKSRAEAVRRLRQVEYFKHKGNLYSWRQVLSWSIPYKILKPGEDSADYRRGGFIDIAGARFTPEYLEQLLGPPTRGMSGGGKVSAEWVIVFDDGEYGTVYDYKGDPGHIGGRSRIEVGVAERIKDLLLQLERAKKSSLCSMSVDEGFIPTNKGQMPPEDIISELTYSNYAYNRDISPDITPEEWADIFGPSTPKYERRYQWDLANGREKHVRPSWMDNRENEKSASLKFGWDITHPQVSNAEELKHMLRGFQLWYSASKQFDNHLYLGPDMNCYPDILVPSQTIVNGIWWSGVWTKKEFRSINLANNDEVIKEEYFPLTLVCDDWRELDESTALELRKQFLAK